MKRVLVFERAIQILLLSTASYACGRDVPRYHLQDLGVLPGTVLSAGQRINNRGDVAGVVDDANDGTVPFLFRRGQMIPLGLPPGPYTRGFVTDINDRGVVVGINRGGSDFDAAFLYANGQLYGLSNVLRYPIVFRAVGINNHNWIVGNARFEESGTPFGFLYRNGVNTILPSLIPGGYSFAFDINDSGEIIGSAQSEIQGPDGELYLHAVIYSKGRIIDLGTLGGKSSFGAGINDAGHPIGYSDTASGQAHAFLSRRWTMIDLGTLPGDFESFAYGMNRRDHVVGSSVSQTGQHLGVLFRDGMVYDLNALLDSPSELIIEQAMDINDRGAITGSAISRFSPFYRRAVLLTPVK